MLFSIVRKTLASEHFPFTEVQLNGDSNLFTLESMQCISGLKYIHHISVADHRGVSHFQG